ncbi:MAG: dTDP-glucose 4,6-dehydratase [Steroidobacter sp.]
MRRLLVTGGAGFIGANFVHYWLREHPADRIVVLDALTYAGNPANLDPVKDREAFRFVHGDIRDTALIESLLRDERLDVIVHFAAESHVDRSIVGPDAFIQTNVVGTHSLLQAARKVWMQEAATDAHRFQHVSTDEVYGSLGPHDPAFTETTPYAPNSPYSASKAASDHLVRAYHHTYGLNVTISNCSNNYGPYHFPEKLIPLTIVNILEGKPLPVYGDGKNVRDWLHVHDHCRGLEAVIMRGRAGETYNIGGGAERENIEVVKALCSLVDAMFRADRKLSERFPLAAASSGQPSANRIRFVADRPGHDRRYAINCDKLKIDLGYAPDVPIIEGLRRTVEWFIGNEAWWRQVQSGEYRRWTARHYGF